MFISDVTWRAWLSTLFPYLALPTDIEVSPPGFYNVLLVSTLLQSDITTFNK
jgi:hypothetical protein